MRASQIVSLFLFAVSAAFGQFNRTAVSLSGNDAASCTVPAPCRSFSAAMAKTNDGGEVVVLSTAGYGPFTVNKSVSVISPPGVYAGVTATAGTAITVNAPGATVILRNLYLNAVGGSAGVSINSDSVVHLEGPVVDGSFPIGIEVTSAGEVIVKDSEIRGSQSGIFLSPSSERATVTIDHVRLSRNMYGLIADSGVDLSVRDTIAVRNAGVHFWFRNGNALSSLRASVERSFAADTESGSLNDGFVADGGARVTICNSAAVRNFYGFRASATAAGLTSEMVIDHCLAAENNFGFIVCGFGAGN